MPFNHKTVMEQKEEFVLLARQSAASFSTICKRFNITRRTGYKWLERYSKQGPEGLKELSRRPHCSPLRTSDTVERRILHMRQENPEWGAKKIFVLLEQEPHTQPIPAKSTINEILKRHGLIKKEKSDACGSWLRFEHEQPNDLWQMDFKGYFHLLNQKQCHPLTILDDHSRFNIGLFACYDEKYTTVQRLLTEVFQTYGLPKTILADNGSPWAGSRYNRQGVMGITKLEKWLYQQNIRVIHGKPYHPQTQGKEERFHRTLKAELLQYEKFEDQRQAQQRFDWWRHKYNCYRPHEAIGLQAPISRYQVSKRAFSKEILKPEYDSTAITTRVVDGGFVCFQSHRFRVGKAFIGDWVAIKPTLTDKLFEVYFYNQLLTKITLP
jgi:transposase InsO family protein